MNLTEDKTIIYASLYSSKIPITVPVSPGLVYNIGWTQQWVSGDF